MSLERDEFKCKHCGKLILDSTFFAMACRAREISDTPYIITSGYRCEAHNAAVGSTSKNHPSGKAMDIKATDGPSRGKILKGLYLAGFRRIGISFKGGFIHADSMDDVESCWPYAGG
jgi:zinc D-Ala-D-Ala carboxypeptidase